MTRKPLTDAQLIDAYRSNAAARREKSVLHKDHFDDSEGVMRRGGVVTVSLPPNAQPVTALGGRTKVLGGSCISIPELKLLPK